MIQPLVSVCVPNYNNGRYLEACLVSALDQTWPNVEVVLVDDASTDDSLEVAERFAERIRLYRNLTNQGQPAATNRCIELARGKYVVILHSDDQLLPGFASRLVPLLERHPAVGMAVGERLETDESGVAHGITPFYHTDCVIPGERQAKVFMFMSFLPCQVLVRHSLLLQVGGVNLGHVVNLDGLLWFKCALAADVAYVRDPVSIYRIHGESTTAQYNRRIDHMIEYYATLSEMFRLAKERPYLVSHFDAAVKRVAALTLRYCHGVFREGNYSLVRRLLSLATVFDPEIVTDHTWRTMHYCAESTDQDPGELYRLLLNMMSPVARSSSYDPPDGYIPLPHPGSTGDDDEA
ncbi:MAG: glycosyltransferase family 2 protein [Pseudomonadota bacterium]